MHGIVIGGTHSGCGKTTVTVGILAALKKKGLIVQSFKAGPDFIDSGLHRLATERPPRNLDLWMCGERYVRAGFIERSSGADMTVIEGVMGLFDGQFNTASLASVLGLPVVLIVDGYGMAETAGALIRGCALQARENGTAIAGVIFNRVASERHFERLRASLTDVNVLGYLPRDAAFEIPHRHLGLTVLEENPIAHDDLERLGEAVLKWIDTDTLIGMARKTAPPPQTRVPSSVTERESPSVTKRHMDHFRQPRGPVIAIAYDRAFTFYYEDNLDLLKESGARIVRFSPLHDQVLPAMADAVYLGGGYPELYAAELSANSAMRRSIKSWADAGRPLYGECGGLMYLSTGIRDFAGNYFAMAGVFPFETRMKKNLSRLGYRAAILKEDCLIGRKGDEVRGHEFHYSEIVENENRWAEAPRVYWVKDNAGRTCPDEGYRYKNSLASYIHLHFGSNERTAHEFVKRAGEVKK